MAEKVYSFVKSATEGRIGIDAPPNERFGRMLERSCPNALWNESLGAWFFDEQDKWKVQALLDRYFPNEGEQSGPFERADTEDLIYELRKRGYEVKFVGDLTK